MEVDLGLRVTTQEILAEAEEVPLVLEVTVSLEVRVVLLPQKEAEAEVEEVDRWKEVCRR